jgi:hypothetical protein
MYKKETEKRVIVDVDRELVNQSHAQAMLQDKTWKKWVAEAFREKLNGKIKKE